jgi:hypothetical protein
VKTNAIQSLNMNVLRVAYHANRRNTKQVIRHLFSRTLSEVYKTILNNQSSADKIMHVALNNQ